MIMKPERKCGIYGIRNTINGKWYIGQSIDIYGRWRAHKTNMKHGQYLNQWLDEDWDKFGASAFEFQILEECSPAMLTVRENAWIGYYHSRDRGAGYNKTPGTNSWATVKSLKTNRPKTRTIEVQELNGCSSQVRLIFK